MVLHRRAVYCCSMSARNERERQLYTLREAAVLSGAHPVLLRRAVVAGDDALPSVQLKSGQRLVALEDIERFLAERERNPRAQAGRKSWQTRRAKRRAEQPGEEGR